jgi:ATP-binding cassette subfamily B protein
MVGGVLALNGLLIVPEGSVALGIVASFLLLSRNFSRPITMVSQQINSIVMALAGAERVFELMDEKPETDEGYVTLVNARLGENGEIIPCEEHTGTWAWYNPKAKEGDPKYILLRGEITLEKVDFEYIPGKQVLNDITVYAKPGQKIAFVGSTGAGKTTITNLLNRFYDIQSGEITIDGKPLKSYSREHLRSNIAMVLQDTHLFTGTVRENIRYGRLDATDEEVIAAAKTASAHSFIMRLENGYDTILEGDGANLSQGQRQLLNIARAALSKAPILVLDEATSSVDTRTERHIEHGMDRLMKDRTTFVIAHRLSTVRNANAIMVLEKGEIIERGDHDDLLAQKGRYYELYTGLKELD